MPLSPSARPLTAVALTLSPLLVIRMLWHLLTPGDTFIVNGALTPGADGWILAVVTAAWWTLAVLCGVAAYAGRARPLVAAAKALPTALLALGTGAVGIVAVALLLGQLLPADPGIVVLLLAGTVVAIGLAIVPLVLAAAYAVIRPGRMAFAEAERRANGRRWSTVFRLGGGVLLPALAIGYLSAQTRPAGVAPALLIGAAIDLALVGVATVQARTLCRLSALEPGPYAVPRRPLVLLAAVAVLLPTVVAGWVVASDRPARIDEGKEINAGIVQLGWPAGRHPILVSQEDILDCLDDTCSAVTRTPMGLTLIEANKGAVIGPDGSVTAIGQEGQLAYCDPQRRCVGGSRNQPLGPSAGGFDAITLEAAGTLLIATATPGEGDGKTTVLGLVRCADVRCAEPVRIALGTVDAPIRVEATWNPRRIGVGLGRDGRPIVMVDTARGLWVGWCTTAACTSTQVAPYGSPAAPDEAELAGTHIQWLLPCQVPVCPSYSPAMTTADPRGGIFAVSTRKGPDDAGTVAIHVGERPEVLTVSLLKCADYRCTDPVRVPVSAGVPSSSNLRPPYPDELWLIAANPDGRVALVRPDYSPHTVFTVRI